VIHRHIETSEWTLTAIESLFDRGDLSDWREFASALRGSEQIAQGALQVCRRTDERGAAEIASALIEQHHPALLLYQP
jgi:hypothetical protein